MVSTASLAPAVVKAVGQPCPFTDAVTEIMQPDTVQRRNEGGKRADDYSMATQEVGLD